MIIIFMSSLYLSRLEIAGSGASSPKARWQEQKEGKEFSLAVMPSTVAAYYNLTMGATVLSRRRSRSANHSRKRLPLCHHGDQIESIRMLFNCLLKFSSNEQGRQNQQKPMMDLQKCALLCMAWHSTTPDGHGDVPSVGRRTERGLRAQPIFQRMKIPATCVTRKRAANALSNKWAQEID
jgi:hypothetical protein